MWALVDVAVNEFATMRTFNVEIVVIVHFRITVEESQFDGSFRKFVVITMRDFALVEYEFE